MTSVHTVIIIIGLFHCLRIVILVCMNRVHVLPHFRTLLGKTALQFTQYHVPRCKLMKFPVFNEGALPFAPLQFTVLPCF